MTDALPPALDFISIQLHAAVALIQFNRPKIGNALNQKTFQVCILLLLLLDQFDHLAGTTDTDWEQLGKRRC